MLVDLPLEWQPTPDSFLDALADATDGPRELTRLAQGVYLGHLNAEFQFRQYIADQWPFSKPGGTRYGSESAPYDFGVCDHWHQIIDRWPVLITDPRPFLIKLTTIVRRDQPEEGGWRWHKWGPYIGNYEISHEYLHDELINEVTVWQIYEMDGWLAR